MSRNLPGASFGHLVDRRQCRQHVTVIQNKNVPTGHVEIELKKEDEDGKQCGSLYVSDVNEAAGLSGRE